METRIKYLDLKRLNDAHDAEIRQAIDRVLHSGWYLRGEATSSFEQHYAQYIGTRHCVAVANGLDALTLILRAYHEMGLMQEGDEVIVPANTYIASILAITENRLVPVLVEPDINTLQIDDSLIEQAITPRTRAVMIVHLYGRCAFTPRIHDICQRHHLKLIEDNAQAHGCTYLTTHSLLLTSPKLTGSLGHAAGHSFYPGKNLGALGDAGAVTTDDAELADLVRALGNYGSSAKYVNDMAGRNSRIDELQAAILDVKLSHLDAENRRRKAIAALYINKVNNPAIRIPRSDRDSVWHIFPILTECRDQLQNYLLDHGVETQVHYPIPPHQQRCFSGQATVRYPLAFGSAPQTLPITERIHREELSLPCNSAITDDEVLYIADLLNAF